MDFQHLPDRWYTLRYVPEHYRLWNSTARFRVVPAGRRSGKTELAKRFTIQQALSPTNLADRWFACTAPTRDQAKSIYWDDLKALSPKSFVRKIRESDLSIIYINGTRVSVVGLDVPARIEGPPLDGCICDEYGNMKPEVWPQHLRPSLSTLGRPGWCWFIGVPEGRNHYWRLYNKALRPDMIDWDVFHWKSSEVLTPEELLQVKMDIDELSYDQEYNASFVNFAGRAYYPFVREIHAKQQLKYYSHLDLNFSFDFNIKPGTAAISQEQIYEGERTGNFSKISNEVTAVIGEIHIPQNSATKFVCRRLIKDWGHHKGKVYCYGDPSGGAGHTSQNEGNDWEIIRDILRPVFKDRLYFRLDKAHPRERARINTVNTRLENANDMISLIVCPVKAPHVVDDFEGVTLLEGGSGEIDKKKHPELTHYTDGIGYMLCKLHPLTSHKTIIEQV